MAATPSTNVLSLTRHNQQDPGVDRPDVRPAAIDSVGVVGAGVMGCAIAAANLQHGIPVTITDASAEALARCESLILEELGCVDLTPSADAERRAATSVLLRVASDDSPFADCDLVIESIVENPEVKRRVLQRLEPQLRDDAVVGSNTSTIPIGHLAAVLDHPGRLCGIHFCNPVRYRRLVEVVRSEASCDETVATACAYAKRLGKLPIVVRDSPAFLVNRLLFPYLNESLELITEGYSPEDIERAALDFGMLKGPLRLYDLIGIDTCFYAGRTMFDVFRDRLGASPILPALIKSDRLGQKNGRGFYLYPDGDAAPHLDASLDERFAPYVRGEKRGTGEELTRRLFLPMLLEATRALEEGIVRDPRDVDLASIFGLGFPESKGGLLYWADQIGAPQVLEMLQPLAPLGLRATPTESLVRMAEQNERFYAD
jgi:3-hydroxyacyl-CoA dehydrogenase/enoyl-CoA hydratase/3-hydroxybutyryl-CoA epimerase/3-hydroxyacyl-CoA dehydrogenase/enoyl-CoA hydratase/3-hydroxybutyryl-CoA epimerase/enoyl-CoA isomerase